MTLLDRAKTMSEALPRLQGLQQEQHRLKKYITREEQLRTEAVLLSGYNEITRELRAKGTEPAGFLDACRGHRRELQRVANEFKADPASIDDQPAATFWEPLKGTSKKVKAGVLAAWKKYVEQNIPPIESGILSTLSDVPGMAKQAESVRQLLTKMKGFRDTLPDQGDFEKVELIATQIRKAWDDLNGEEVPQAVLDFLRSAHASSGAQLAIMTTEVFNWLDTMNLLNNYVVKTKGWR